MKLNIYVDLDWLEDDGNIDKNVQDEIIQGVKNAISKDCLALVNEKTKQAIDDGLNDSIDLMRSKVSEFFETWLNTEATITDKYGDKIEKGTLREIIKREFNDCMNQKVNAEGKHTDGYGAKYTRLEFVTGKKVKQVVDDYLSSYGKDIDRTIKEQIDEGIKTRVSNKFAEMVIGYAQQDYKNAQAIENKG